jgi:hypothetical protein
LLSGGSLQAAEPGQFGVGLGFVHASDVEDGGSAWFTANYRVEMRPHLVIEPELGYWKKSEGDPDLVQLGIRDLNVGVHAIFRPEMDGPLRLWMGAGPGVHLVKVYASLLGFSDSETRTKPALHFLGGLDYELNESLVAFGSVRYDVVGQLSLETENDTSLNQFKLYGGVRFRF